MMHAMRWSTVGIAILLAGCTSLGTYSLAEQCGHKPGCVTARASAPRADTPLFIDAIRAPDAGAWEPVVPVRPKGKR